MRLIGTAAAFYIGAIASAQDPTTSATSHGKRKTHVEVSAIRAADAASAKAIRRHRHDFREDAPGAGRQCTPSSLWAKEVDPTEYEIGCKEIEVLLRGNDTFAGQGLIREVVIAPYDGRQVAVKTLVHTTRFAEHAHWLEITASDAVKGRPHIVDMLGFCGATVVTEKYSKTVEYIVRHAKEPLPIDQVISISLDAAIGLEALHEAAVSPIVHFDVKIDQLLIGDDGRVSLGDFNCSYFMGTYPDGSPCPFNRKKRKMTVNRVRAPEYTAYQPLTEKVDIYRMGLIYAEILSAGGSTPFVAKEGGTLSLDPTWHQGYVTVVQDMLGKAERRPSASDLVLRLQEIQEELFRAS